MDFRKKGKLIAIRKRSKPVAFLAAFLFIYLQTFSAFACDFTVVSGSVGGCSSNGSGGYDLSNIADGTVINWNGFNIPLGQSFSFLFSNAGGSVLNNVLGGAASNILGSIFSNGYVFLINPAGINIGASASINVAGFVASSLTMSTANFVSGNYVFENGAQAGSVINQGTITAQPGGFVALLGGSVANSGSVIADLGSVVLASGEKMTLSFDPNGLINLVIDEQLASTITNVQDAVLNTGLIRADGGKVILHAEAAQDLFTHLVNNTGIIEANSVVERNGVIELIANGAISNAGIINADGSVENPNGGSINILGDTINHAGVISANALDYGTAGDVDVVSLYGTYLLSGSVISSRGIGELSQGGNVYINALYGSTDFQQDALIDISGGITGNGGTLDLSAFGGDLHVGGSVFQAVADGYTGGLVIFDPDGNITFSTNQIVAGNILLTSNGGIIINNNVIIQSTGGSVQVITDANNTNDDGVFTMNSGSKILAFNNVTIDGSSFANATLREVRSTGGGQILIGTNRAFNSVSISSGSLAVPFLQAAGGITILANNGITINNNTNGAVANEVESTLGNVFLNADADGNGSGTFTMANNTGILAGGNVEIYGAGNTTIRNVSATGASSQIIIGTGASTSFNNITLAGLVQGNGGVDINAFNDLSINNNVQSVAGDIDLMGGGNVSIATNTTVQSTGGGNITLLANSDGNASGNFSMANNSSVITNDGNISISGRGNLTVRTVSAGAGDVSITSTNGSILDDNNNSTKITGDAVTLTAAGAIGQSTANNDIDLSANSLTATASNGIIRAANDQALTVNSAGSTNGSVTISASGNLTANSVSASGTGANNITLTSSTGNVTLGNINAADSVAVSATAGNILDDGNQATAVSGTTVNMTASGNIGSAAANGDIDISSTTNIGALASTGNGDIFARISGGGANLTGADFVTTGSVTVSTEGASSITGATGYNNFSMTATSGNLEIGTVSASNAVTLAATNGDVTDANSDSSVSGSTVNLAAGGADGDIGTVANQINTTSGILNLTGTGTGDIFVTESNGATIGATTGSGSINLASTTGNLEIETVSTSGNVNLTASAGDLTDTNTNSSITGNILTLIAGGANGDIGAAGQAINTSANALSLTGTGAGNIFITESNGATLNSTTGSGIIDVMSTTGNLEIETVSTSGNVNLTASAGDLTDNNTNSSITGNTVSLVTGGADGDIGASGAQINTTATTLNLTGAGTGDIFVTESDGATLSNATTGSGVIDVTSTTGTLSVGTVTTTGNVNLTAAAGDLTSVSSNISGNTVTLTAGGADGDIGASGAQINTTATTLNLTGAGTGDIFVTESDGAAVAASAGSGSINVTSTTGDLNLGVFSTTGAINLSALAGNLVDAGSSLAGNVITLIGNSIGTLAARINTTGITLNATANTGGIFLQESNGATLNNIDSSAANGVINIISTTGNLTVATVNAGSGDVSLSALAGSLLNDANGTTRITGSLVTLIGDAIGSLADKIDTAANTLSATANNGGIFINELDGVTIQGLDSSVANGDININNATGDMTLGNAALQNINAGAGTVTLTATTGNIIDDFVQATRIIANTLFMTAFGNIGSSLLNGDIDFNIGANGIGTLQSTGGGSISIGNVGGLDIAAGDFITTGAVSVTTGGSSTVTGVSGVSDFSITTTSGNLTVGDVAAANSASFTAQAGDIVDDGSNATSITSSTVNLTGMSVGTSANNVATAANAINATSTNGDIFLTESNGATLNANSSAGNGNITATTTTGDWTLGTINAGNGGFAISAANGNVLDGNGAANNVTAGTNSSITAGGSIGTTGDGLDVDINNGAVLTTTAGGQDGGGTSINVDGDINGQLVNPGTDLDFDLGGPNEPSGNVFYNGNLLFPIVIPPVIPAVSGGLTSLAGINFTDLLSPLFPQWSVRRQPALFT